MGETTPDLQVEIEATSDDYDPSDSRWMDELLHLHDDLQRDAGDVSRETKIAEGQKGGIESIILALGSAGAITAAVQIFQSWLGRDRTRSLSLSVTRDGVVEKFEVSGKGMSEETIGESMKQWLELRAGS